MKKLFALILTVCLLATMSVTAFAAEIDQDTPAPKDGSTSVYFEVDPTYTVTIPATVELQKKVDGDTVTYENDYTITASENLRLRYDEYITVTVSDGFLLNTAEGASLFYEITVGGNKVDNGDVVAVFNTSIAAQSATMHIAADDPDYAGRYEGTLTFTIAVEKVTVS